MKEIITIRKRRIYEAIWAFVVSGSIFFLIAHTGTIVYEKDYTPSAKQEINNIMFKYNMESIEKQKIQEQISNLEIEPGQPKPFRQVVNPYLASAAAPAISVGPYEYGIVKGTWELKGFTGVSINYEHNEAVPRWGINQDKVNYIRRANFYFLSIIYNWYYTITLTTALILILWGVRHLKRNYDLVIR